LWNALWRLSRVLYKQINAQNQWYNTFLKEDIFINELVSFFPNPPPKGKQYLGKKDISVYIYRSILKYNSSKMCCYDLLFIVRSLYLKIKPFHSLLFLHAQSIIFPCKLGWVGSFPVTLLHPLINIWLIIQVWR
jgi:hypothetical protein